MTISALNIYKSWNVHGSIGITPCHEYDMNGNLKRVISPEEQICNGRKIDDELMTQIRVGNKAEKEHKKAVKAPIPRIKAVKPKIPKPPKPPRVLAKELVPLLTIGEKVMQINDLIYDKLEAVPLHFEIEGSLIKVRKPRYEDTMYNTDYCKLEKSKKFRAFGLSKVFIIGRFEGDCAVFDTREAVEQPPTHGMVWRMTLEELEELRKGTSKL